jgi:hypothetical protein
MKIFITNFFCIVIYIKITKSNKICRFKKYTYSDLHICVTQTTKHLNLIFRTLVE